jgi:hypothetical protein
VIYLNNAATTLQKPPCVAAAVLDALQNAGSAGRGGHEASLAADRLVFRARVGLAGLFGCADPARVVFTANATQALNTAIFGMFAPGDHLIATDWDHNSMLRPLYALRQQGVAVDFVPADRQGNLDYSAFARLLRPNTRAVLATHASNLTGNLLAAFPPSACCARPPDGVFPPACMDIGAPGACRRDAPRDGGRRCPCSARIDGVLRGILARRSSVCAKGHEIRRHRPALQAPLNTVPVRLRQGAGGGRRGAGGNSAFFAADGRY